MLSVTTLDAPQNHPNLRHGDHCAPRVTHVTCDLSNEAQLFIVHLLGLWQERRQQVLLGRNNIWLVVSTRE